MLYLAEIQKRSGIMGSRAELKLLACQRSEQIWNAIAGDELVPLSAEQANNYNSGALVLVDLTTNKQVQRFQEAGRQLVNILQNFSKLQERVRLQEDEIEQWKASLTFQSQELQRREIEIEARQEQIQHMDADLAELQKQREELEQTRAEVQQLQSDLEANRQNLDGAWQHLRGEQQRLEELQTQVQSHASGLSPEQSHALSHFLDQFGNLFTPMQSLPDSLQGLTQAIANQQATVQHYQQQLDETTRLTQELQNKISAQAQEIANRQGQIEELERSLDSNTTELSEQQRHYKIAQELHEKLSAALKTQDNLQQRVCQAAGLSNPSELDDRIDINALDQMPIEELENVVANLQRDLKKLSLFVSDQEEELRYQQEAIDEIHAQIAQAGEYDRLHLETKLADEKDRYRLLDETLIGQRRTLRERESVLNAHISILKCRQGQNQTPGSESWQSLLSEWRESRQHQIQDIQKLEGQLQQLPALMEHLESTISDQTLTQVHLQQEISELEHDLSQTRLEAAVQERQVQTLGELLQTLQGQLEHMQSNLGTMTQIAGEVEATREQQEQMLTHVRQNLNGVLN